MEPKEENQKASDRMQKILTDLKLSADDLGVALGRRKGDVIRNVLNLRNAISHNLAYSICAVFPQFRYEWLRYGQGEPYLTDAEIKNLPKTVETDYTKAELLDMINKLNADRTSMIKIISDQLRIIENLSELRKG